MSEKRRIGKLLPDFMQENNQLAKFFGSTVDPLFQPENKVKLAGYVGRKPDYYDASTDTYIVEPTEDRQYYQLEPTMISSDTNGINQIQTYPDLVNHLRFQGANVSDHSRLFDQQYMAWSPPIDIDNRPTGEPGGKIRRNLKAAVTPVAYRRCNIRGVGNAE